MPLNDITAVILDIEGTVAPISFVKDVLFPYFLSQLPKLLATTKFPIDPASSTIDSILSKFPAEFTTSKEALLAYIEDLVARDVKEANLKALQGFVWQFGYESGDLKAPVYKDAIEHIKIWSETKKVYIYSSGSVKSQKLLFGYVEDGEGSLDLNKFLSGYFDITTSGYKFEKSSYESIVNEIGVDADQVLFLSDNVREVSAAVDAGLHSKIVDRPGNAPVSDQDKETYGIISDFSQLKI